MFTPQLKNNIAYEVSLRSTQAHFNARTPYPLCALAFTLLLSFLAVVFFACFFYGSLQLFSSLFDDADELILNGQVTFEPKNRKYTRPQLNILINRQIMRLKISDN